ncbi:hypothetical protein GIB67_011090, partial [Kingdonia uniflora]
MKCVVFLNNELHRSQKTPPLKLSYNQRFVMFGLMMGYPQTPFSETIKTIPKYKHDRVSMMVSGSCSAIRITCGLRKGARKSLWRSRVLSTEAIQAVQSIKLAKSASKLEEVFGSRLGRLLKGDLLDTLAELQRQNEWELAAMVFEFMHKKLLYKPDLSLYYDMIFLFGKNKMIEPAEQLFLELRNVGLEPDSGTYTEMIGAYLQVGMVDKAMETYISMKKSGCSPNKLTLTILIRNLEKAGEEELASIIKNECAQYVESPKKFLEEVGKKYSSRRDALKNSESKLSSAREPKHSFVTWLIMKIEEGGDYTGKIGSEIDLKEEVTIPSQTEISIRLRFSLHLGYVVKVHKSYIPALS